MRETKLWTWHMLAGMAILILGGLHMLIMHFDSFIGVFNWHKGGALAWENVLERSRLLFFTITYVLLLGVALWHGLYGLRTILFELGIGPGLQRAVNVVFWIGGVALFAVGTWAAVVSKGL